MATFYIQLENKLLQISGELTAENISKALGYVPVSPNVTNELSQRIDNITFDSLKDNPFLQDGSGELNIVDEAGNIIAKVSSEGVRTVEVLVGEHRLSEKANKSDLPTKLSDLDNDTNYITLADIPPVNIPSLDEYVTEEELNSKGYITQHQDISHLATKAEVSDIDFYNIKNNPVINSETGKLLFVDESGNIGLQLENNGLYVSNVFAGPHVLSNKADKSEVPTSTSQLTNDSGYVTKPIVDQAIASLVDSAPETLNTIGEIASALKNNANIVDVLHQSISTKQNTIEDLEAIRAGAVKGATALQEIPEEYVTRDEIPNLPSLDEYAKKEDIPSLDGYATQAWVNNKNYATEEDLSSIEFNSLQNNPLVEDSNGEFNLIDDLGNVGFKVNQEGLFVKDVIAGNHILSNKANISDINDKQDKLVSGTNIKTINGTSILGEGNLTVGGSAKVYNWTMPTDDNGDIINQGNISQEELDAIVNADILIVNNVVAGKDDQSDDNAILIVVSAVGYQVVALYTIIIAKQTLAYQILPHEMPIPTATSQLENDSNFVSSESLKTINGESIVGSGNIEISGGGGSSSGNGAYSEVNHGTSDTTFTLTPNTFHIWDEVANLTLTLGSETSGVANEFLFQFTSGATATTLSLPSDLKWANDSAPTIEPNMIYQVSILKGLASVLEFSNAPALIENKVTVSISGTKYLVSLQYAAASNIVVKVRTADGLISVSILSGEISKTANSIGPMVDSGAFIESITPSVDTAYNYVW